jgi:hypothetical protein
VTDLAAHRLPGLEDAGLPRQSLEALPIAVPIVDAGSVQRVWERLDAAAARWRGLPLVERVDGVARLAAALRRRGPGPWTALLERSTGLSPAGLAAAWESTFAPVDAAALHAALAADGLDAEALQQRAPRRAVHILAGNVLPPTFALLVRGWVLGAAQWLRPAAREPLFAACVAAALPELAPALADTLAVLWWPHDDARTAPAVLGGAELVTAHGDDASVAALERQVARLAPAARFVGHGSRWSLALVSAVAQTEATARGLARDVALFDQQGCLSPSLVLAESGPGLETWCGAVAAAFADLERRMPRGPLPPPARAALRHWRRAARLDQAFGTVLRVWESDGSTAWALVLRRDLPVPLSPLDRHLAVVPFTTVDDVGALLGARRGQVQGLAAALEGWNEEARRSALEVLRPTRVARPGELQAAPPGWRQDHRAPFASWLA